MTAHDLAGSSTTGGLPVAPSMGPSLAGFRRPPRAAPAVDGRLLLVCAAAMAIAMAAAGAAQLLGGLIALITNLAFYGQFSLAQSSPAANRLGAWVVLIPALGGVVVGLMARYGSAAIRGHGIPEAMERIIANESRIPKRMVLLKPLSAAIAIGTGGPFGAEGPIIATGGALGSMIGQLITTTAAERKTLLAAGAAAGMAATFGCPVAALLLAVELLLFEYRPRSLIPVALASATATAVRIAVVGPAPVFAIPDLVQPQAAAIAAYVVVGLLVGVAAVGVTRAVYAIEDAFSRLPLHWMWWPALGGVAVGVVGWCEPRTLGVGYDNIQHLLSGDLPLGAAAALCAWKFVSWSIALGSGTSGGTLAPLLTIGGGCGLAAGIGLAWLLPAAGIDPRIAALVGTAAMFAGASRAMLASAVFAFETTRQPIGLLPLFGGCAGAYLISLWLMRHSIMTEKIARRGVRVVAEYGAEVLDHCLVRERMSRRLETVAADETVAAVRARWLAPGAVVHKGYPVVDGDGHLVSLVLRRQLLDGAVDPAALVGTLANRAPGVIHAGNTLREAIAHMLAEGVGRLPVVADEDPRRLLGIITSGDIIRPRREDSSDGESP